MNIANTLPSRMRLVLPNLPPTVTRRSPANAWTTFVNAGSSSGLAPCLSFFPRAGAMFRYLTVFPHSPPGPSYLKLRRGYQAEASQAAGREVPDGRAHRAGGHGGGLARRNAGS